MEIKLWIFWAAVLALPTPLFLLVSCGGPKRNEEILEVKFQARLLFKANLHPNKHRILRYLMPAGGLGNQQKRRDRNTCPGSELRCPMLPGSTISSCWLLSEISSPAASRPGPDASPTHTQIATALGKIGRPSHTLFPENVVKLIELHPQ